MKYRLLLVISLIFTITSATQSKSLIEEQQRVRFQTLRNTAIQQRQLTPLERAYLDASTILDGDNKCSSFFGGSRSLFVLTELAVRLRERTILDPRVGILMSGTFTTSVQDGLWYRTFERTEVNVRGAFYSSLSFSSELKVTNVASFAPNTRAARVMMLFHELAHMIRSTDSGWLIPDDGNNTQLSRKNTQRIEAQCGNEIRALPLGPKY